MTESRYEPIATREIAMPVLEEGPSGTTREPILPRILRQAAGSDRAERNLVLLALLFAALSLVELGLLFRLSQPDALVVYRDVPRKPLVEPLP
ncbi:MAG TPA: hypothetical protein VMU54_21695 [Planctomycetota bacterium]|nr:hypothetical protein [Planctomycetota bacterium]